MPSWSMRPKPVCLSWDRSMAKTIRSKSTGSKSSLLTGSMLELAALPSCTRCILPIPGPLWPPGDAVVTSGAARWHAQQSNSGGAARAPHFQNVKRSGLHRSSRNISCLTVTAHARRPHMPQLRHVDMCVDNMCLRIVSLEKRTEVSVCVCETLLRNIVAKCDPIHILSGTRTRAHRRLD